MIELTQVANAALTSLLKRKGGTSSLGLRLFVQKGGCAGLQYRMEVEDKQDGDLVSGTEEARIFIAENSLEYLRGMTLDYSISLADSGFKIINPNAARSCGCGTSFEPEKGTENADKLEQGEACPSEE